ncbi:MAG: hypothetical protein WCH21_12595 [Bacteroidota bacterium]
MGLNIGSIIKSIALEKKMDMKVLAKRMGMHPVNLGRVFNKMDMNTKIVKKFCVELDYDFFEHYSGELKLKTATSKKLESENALAVSNEKVERLEQENVYLKEINELLRKKN